MLDTCNDLTFGDSSTSDGQKPASSGKGYEELQVWLSSSLLVVYSRAIGDMDIDFLSG